MGCNDCCEVFYAPNEAKARVAAREIIMNDRHENGSGSYTGSIGGAGGCHLFLRSSPDGLVASRELLFGTEAGEWLDGKCEKWGPAILMEIAKGGKSPRKRRWMLAAQVAS